MIFSAAHFMTAETRKELFYITAIHYGLSKDNYSFCPNDEALDSLFEWYKKDLKENKDYSKLHSSLKSGELRKRLNENGFEWVVIWYSQ